MDAHEFLAFDMGRGFSRLNVIRDTLNNIAERAFGILRVAASVVAGETVTIGTDVFVVDAIHTTTGVITASGQANHATGDLTLTVTAHGLIVGDLISIGTEILRVVRVVDVDNITVSRAACGTPAATHADGVTIYKSSTPGTILAAGHIPVGLIATLTPTAFTAAMVAMLNADLQGHTHQSGLVVGTLYDVNTLLVTARVRGLLALATTETLAGSGNAWDAATLTGGINPARRRFASGARVPTAAEVTAGVLLIPVDFTPLTALIQVVVTGTGVRKSWDGATALVAPTGLHPGYVKLDNSGTTDWAATDTITYLIGE